jgi:hypothetical protein
LAFIASRGLDPRVHVFWARAAEHEDVDARIKSGQGDCEMIPSE